MELPTQIPSLLRLTQIDTSSIELRAADKETGKRRFSMSAYTGGVAETGIGPVVIDLAGMELGGQRKPILREHDRTQIVGYSDKIELTDSGILIEGTLSSRTPSGIEVTNLADEGFPWQASVGLSVKSVEMVKQDASVEVNGAQFSGPGFVIRKSFLKESSFVPLGADSATSAAVFADGAKLIDVASTSKETAMAEPTNKPDSATAIADAENAGFTRGYEQAKLELSEMLAAFPTDTTFALEQYRAGKKVNDAKAVFADTLSIKLSEANAKIADLEKRPNVSSTAAVAVQLAATAAGDKPTDNPKAQAEWEWDNEKPTGFSSKASYVGYRNAVLTGRLREVSVLSK